MSFWTAIVVIVAIFALVRLRVEKYRSVNDRSDTRHLPAASSADVEHELREVKERLAVLERILTDERRSRSLADEIESLRER